MLLSAPAVPVGERAPLRALSSNSSFSRGFNMLRTSHTHPITVSWIIGSPKPLEGEGASETLAKVRGFAGDGDGALGLCYCPGKKVIRDGVRWERSMKLDLSRLRSHFGVTTVVNLLNLYELRSYSIHNYGESVTAAGLQYVEFPMIEMAAPDSMEGTEDLVADLIERLGRGEKMVVHCRGGVGRAATITACVLLEMGLESSDTEVIATMRRLRCKRAVESRTQEQFIKRYLGTIRGRGVSGAAHDEGETEAP